METVIIAAGGTGGHINAALSLGNEYSKDYQVIYLSGKRHLDYKLFKDKDCLHLNSRPLRTKNPFILIKNITLNIFTFIGLFFFYFKKNPKMIIGAGGYVCGPALLMGKFLFKPVFIIEQNAVVGLTNKILANFSNLIFTNFQKTKGLGEKFNSKIKNVGNPIRQEIVFKENTIKEETYNILVFGGSLGATQINSCIKNLISSDLNYSLNILHQVGKGNQFEVTDINENIKYEQVEYIENMNEKYDWSNIIIARAGASTVSELRVVKRPSIIIPYPAATDNHQYYNALNLKEENLSFISILDHNKKEDQLSKDLIDALKEIISKKLFYSSETTVDNAVLAIKNEINSYVRN